MDALSLSGLASGFDWKSLVDQLTQVERAPQQRLRVEQSNLQSRNSALSALASQFGSLQAKAKALSDKNLYGALAASSSDATAAKVQIGQSAQAGSYQINISQLATVASQKGGADAGKGVDANADITTSASGFGVKVSAGTFTINNAQVTIAAGDTLNDVLSNIQSAAGVSAVYNSSTDKIELSSGNGQPLVLGSAADTSNFLQAARLSNNGTGQIQSNLQLGGISLSDSLSSARYATAISSGSFKINGVSFSYSSSDTTADLLKQINQSSAGVTASYDSVNDRFSLTNKATGDVGIALEDVSGNFLQATKLLSSAGGTLASGQDALFSINGGATLSSHDNTLTESSHGIQGLSITALKAGSNVTVNVANDSSAVKSALNDFVDEYNKTQALIDVQTASTTDAKGVVTAGVLANDPQVAEAARTLRSKLLGDVSGGSGLLGRLASLGYSSDGYTNKISLSDPAALDKALSNSASDVQSLFADPADGVATRMSSYLDTLIGPDGGFSKEQDTYTTQSSRIDQQVSVMEDRVQSNRQRLIDSFVQMEQAISQINSRSQFLLQRFG